MAYEFNRNLQDSAYTSTVALIAAGGNSATFDLEQVIGGDIEKVVFEIASPAAPSLIDGKVVTYTFKDSPDGTTFTVVDPTIVMTTATTTGSTGLVAKTVRFRLPPITKRYVRVEYTVTATPTGLSGSMVAKLLF